MSHSQPFQELSGVKTWVNDSRDTGKDKGTPAPEKSREDYADGKPQRDRVLPLPNEHSEGRTEYRANPPVMNTPPDSSGSSPAKQNSPYAIPNHPNGKPLHERTRSLPTGGEEYGHPYLDQSQSTGLSRRVATDDFYWDIDSQGELIEVRTAKINIRPRKRQRAQKGQVKRQYQKRRRSFGRKNKDVLKNKRKRQYRRDRPRRLRQMKTYRENRKRRSRLQGGGVSTNKQRNNKSRKAYSKELTMDFYDINESGNLVLAEDNLAEDNLAEDNLAEDRLSYKKMPSMQKQKMLKSRKTNKSKNQSKKRERSRKDKKNVTLKTRRKKWQDKTKNVRKYSSVSTKLKTMQLFLAVLRGAHWAHWTSHWQVKGSNSYGDHLLLQRLYQEIEAEIDTLAEKIVGEFGTDSVEPVEQAKLMANEILPRAEFKDPIDRALFVETALQEAFKLIYDTLKNQSSLSLGLDDYIMSIANAHETNLYLLRQRKDSHNG